MEDITRIRTKISKNQLTQKKDNVTIKLALTPKYCIEVKDTIYMEISAV